MATPRKVLLLVMSPGERGQGDPEQRGLGEASAKQAELAREDTSGAFNPL